MCLPSNWTTVHRLQRYSEDRTDTLSLSTASSESDTFIEHFQETNSLTESDQTQINPEPDQNQTIWDIRIPTNIRIRQRYDDLESIPRDAQRQRRV